MTAQVKILDNLGAPLTTANPMPVNVVGGVTISNAVEITNDAGSPVPVSGTFYQATQPVSGPLTDTQLRATAVPVSGTVTANQGTAGASAWPVTGPLTDTQLRATAVPVSGPLTDTQLRATAVPVSGTFWQATQPVSGTVAATQSGNWPVRNQDGAGNNLASVTADPAGTEQALAVRNVPKAATLAVTGTAAAAAGVTVTLPAVSGQFHYITMIEITLFASAAGTAAAAPVVVTSTNLPGSLAWSMEAIAAAVGARTTLLVPLSTPLRSSVANTNTTIVCPATASRIWRVNVHYFAAP